MEPLQDTFTVRTRDGREYPGLTLSSLRIAVSQKIFSPEDSARSDRIAGTWTPLARLLTIPDQAFQVSGQEFPMVRPVERPSPVSTGIALDLDRHPAPVAQPPRLPLSNPISRPLAIQAAAPFEEEEGPVRHRLQIAGAYLLFFGILGMVAYAFGKHGPTDSIIMLVNTGFGIALLMNLHQVRKWAAGWVIAGWVLAGLGGTLAAGCFGLVLVGVFAGLGFGGPACLLWGEECPRPRFWTGVTLIGIVLFLLVVGLILIAVAGAALFRQMRF